MYRHAGTLRSIEVNAGHEKVMMKKTIGNRTGSGMPSLKIVSGAQSASRLKIQLIVPICLHLFVK